MQGRPNTNRCNNTWAKRADKQIHVCLKAKRYKMNNDDSVITLCTTHEPEKLTFLPPAYEVWDKVMISQPSIILSMWEGGSGFPQCHGAGRPTLQWRPPQKTDDRQADSSILLECILVCFIFFASFTFYSTENKSF